MMYSRPLSRLLPNLELRRNITASVMHGLKCAPVISTKNNVIIQRASIVPEFLPAIVYSTIDMMNVPPNSINIFERLTLMYCFIVSAVDSMLSLPGDPGASSESCYDIFI